MQRFDKRTAVTYPLCKYPLWMARRIERRLARYGSARAMRWIAFGGGRGEAAEAGPEPAAAAQAAANVVALRPRAMGG
ncbi:hypothetical protein [Methylobacterium nigriterrae]|uniref:hypothetical protein n=1 Tax=Methylobacterium nigriterrae TaxID=3127512 RepID=UPI0030139129